MKSAYERAMERLGGGLAEFTPEQKERLAEIGRFFDAKIAQTKLQAEAALRQAGDDAEKEAELRDHLTRDVADYERQRESRKELLRQEFAAGGQS